MAWPWPQWWLVQYVSKDIEDNDSDDDDDDDNDVTNSI